MGGGRTIRAHSDVFHVVLLNCCTDFAEFDYHEPVNQFATHHDEWHSDFTVTSHDDIYEEIGDPVDFEDLGSPENNQKPNKNKQEKNKKDSSKNKKDPKTTKANPKQNKTDPKKTQREVFS